MGLLLLHSRLRSSLTLSHSQQNRILELLTYRSLQQKVEEFEAVVI